MQLVRFLSGHFAPLHSPTRERRELRFAITDPNDAANSKEKSPDFVSTTHNLEKVNFLNTNQKLMLEAPEALLPHFTETCESVDLFEHTLRWAMSDRTLAEFIRTQFKKLNIPDNADLALVEGDTVDKEKRQALMQELLKKHPEIVLRCARNIDEKIDSHNKLIAKMDAMLEGALWKDFKVSTEHEIFAGASLPAIKQLNEAMGTVDNSVLADLFVLLRKNTPELGTEEIARHLQVLPDGQPKQALVNFLVELKRTFHNQSTFGSVHWYEPNQLRQDEDAYRQRQKDYLASLEAQKKALSTLLELRMIDNTETIVNEHVKQQQDILVAIGNADGKLDEKEMHFRLLMRPDATGKKIAGYGLPAFADAHHQHLHPLAELGLTDPEHEERVKATDEGFLDYAAKALPIIQERMSRGERDFERLLAQKRIDQENVERWAFDTAQRLQRLNQLDDERKRPIEKFLQKHLGKSISDLHDRYEPYADPATCASILEQKENRDLLIAATDPEFDPNFRNEAHPELQRVKMQVITALLDQCERRPDVLIDADEAGRELEADRRRMEGIDDPEILGVVQQTRQQLDTVLGDIRQSPYFQHEVCNTLGVADTVDRKNAYIRDTLLAVTEPAGSLAPETLVSVVQEPVNSLSVGIIFTKDLPATTPVSTPNGVIEAGKLPRKTPVSVTSRPVAIAGTIQARLLPTDTPVSTPNAIATLRKNLPQAQREVNDLQEVVKRLRRIKVVEENLGENTVGYFKDGDIHINDKKSEEKQKDAKYHEGGHAALWTLESAFPLLLSEHLNLLHGKEDLLLNLQDSLHYRAIQKQRDEGEWRKIAEQRLQKRYADAIIPDDILNEETDRVFMEKMFNELLVRHAEWVKSQRTMEVKDARELELFRELDKPKLTQLAGESVADRVGKHVRRRRTPEDAAVSSGTLFKPEDEEEQQAKIKRNQDGFDGPPPEQEKEINIQIELREIQRNIEMAQYFINAYKEQYPDVEAELRPYVDIDKQQLDKLNETFLKIQQNGQSAEDDPKLVQDVRNLSKNTKAVLKAIKAIDEEQLDISKVTPTKPPGLFHGIAFVSLSDIGKLWTDLGEDLKSIYKRRQDRVLKEAGAGITDALSLGSKIPYYGEYFAGLRGYHDRRYSGTDVEAANKWQESMKFIDSHKILDLLATTGDKDLLRGGISLLVERGEMDWNDTRVWETFMRLTGYDMPIGACLRKDVLRDTWLRKMVNALWDDKEQYYHWRQGNDSHYESHKKEFTPMVDQFANVGGMKVELKKQLKLWVEWKKTHHTQPLPDDVKPHLYEEVLHYAMRMGKLRMEDKFFYLIQGVRHGLLSIDRLRVLAGDGGEILLRFPFIDYFYQKNNSLDEVTRLGERLEEAGDKFDPGAKTMYFLQYEVPKEQGFKERLSKALGRDNIEKIDHEDFPMIVACIDYGKTDEMTGVLSGSRYKITKESAKNSYVGFNTKFKAFGRLADMDELNKARFTKGDAQSIATTITAFLHFDNLLTRNGWDGLNRLTLTKNDINNTAGPYMAAGNVNVYRDAAYAFIHRLMEDLENAGAFDWGKVGTSGIKEKYIQKTGEMNDERLSLTKPDPHQTDVYQATAKFSSELERALKARTGTDILKETLSLHSDRTRTRTNYLMEESATTEKQYLTKEEAEQYLDDLAKSKNGAGRR